jgi:Mor family transcriptional regulator
MTQSAAVSPPPGYPETLELLWHIVFESLQKKVADTPEATTLAIVERIRIELGGSYLPRGSVFDVKKLKRAVCREFDGINHAALARKHRISETRVRQIIEEERQSIRNFNN